MRAALSLLASSLAASLGVACGRAAEPSGCGSLAWNGRGEGASVVLVVADTLRRDAVGAYGGPPRTPWLDGIAEEGILFQRAHTQAPWTKPSVASLFTSLYPSQHGLTTQTLARRWNPRPPGDRTPRASDVLQAAHVTLAEAYRRAGYATAAFVSNPWLAGSFGFAQGFDVYDDSFARWDAPGALVSLAALRWLRSLDSEQPFLLYLHYLEPHEPYGPLRREVVRAHADALRADERPLPGDAREVAQASARFAGGGSALEEGIAPSRTLIELAYESGVADFDRALGRFLESFAELRDPERVAFVVTSDHGQSLYEHGFGGHGTSLYEAEVAIPLVARLPGVDARHVRNDCPVGLVDVMPLLCDYSGIDCPDRMAGSNRLQRGAVAARSDPVVVEGVRGAPRHRAVIAGRRKLVWAPEHPDLRDRTPWRYFDLEEDPDEQRDLALADPERVERDPAWRRLREWLPRAVASVEVAPSESQGFDPELEERLRALGYAD